MDSIQQIARVCHEANRAYCGTIGDNSQKPWDEAEEWQRDSAIKGVAYALENRDAPASAQHDAWLADKLAAGWKFGAVKNADAKEHPCIVSYEQLPIEQQLKDHLFRAIVAGLAIKEGERLTMRTLTDHIVEGDSANHQLSIEVLDGPGAGGACHKYQITLPEQENIHSGTKYLVTFQNGPIKEAGINGLTQEALLAILIDRMRGFQAGPYACPANENALGHLEGALANLQERTKARITRGVEGTHAA